MPSGIGSDNKGEQTARRPSQTRSLELSKAVQDRSCSPSPQPLSPNLTSTLTRPSSLTPASSRWTDSAERQRERQQSMEMSSQRKYEIELYELERQRRQEEAEVQQLQHLFYGDVPAGAATRLPARQIVSARQQQQQLSSPSAQSMAAAARPLAAAVAPHLVSMPRSPPNYHAAEPSYCQPPIDHLNAAGRLTPPSATAKAVIYSGSSASSPPYRAAAQSQRATPPPSPFDTAAPSGPHSAAATRHVSASERPSFEKATPVNDAYRYHTGGIKLGYSGHVPNRDHHVGSSHIGGSMVTEHRDTHSPLAPRSQRDHSWSNTRPQMIMCGRLNPHPLDVMATASVGAPPCCFLLRSERPWIASA